MSEALDPAARSAIMSRIRGRDTKPELAVRRFLHREGLRFRLYQRNLPGRPDLVFPRYRAVVFVHGCFWHRHQACRLAYLPKSNTEFWSAKFEDNQARDRRQQADLESSGWAVHPIWECETSSMERLRALAEKIRSAHRASTRGPH